jgi:prepilin-type N-terminal cleavage/methylation domain-containing protein
VRYRNQSGFTLLEVLISMSILSASLGILMQIFGSASRSAAISENYRKAILVAESQLAMAKADPALRSVGSRGIADEHFAWAINAAHFDDAGSGASPKFDSIPSVVTIEVSWPDGDRMRSISLSTIVLGVDARQRR